MSALQRPVTVFEQSRWRLLPDPEKLRSYGNVSNRLEITTVNGRSWAVAIAIPTELFLLMRGTWAVPQSASVQLFLDAVVCGGKVWYAFSVYVRDGDKEDLHDLWAVPEPDLPAWMRDRQYWV